MNRREKTPRPFRVGHTFIPPPLHQAVLTRWMAISCTTEVESYSIPNPSLMRAILRARTRFTFLFTAKHTLLLGIPCQLCYKPAEEWSGTRESRPHDDATTFNIIPRAIDPGGSFLQPGPDRLPLPHHAKSGRHDL